MDNQAVTIETAAASYLDFFRRLSTADLDALPDCIDPNIRFRDPFNDVTGLAAFRAVFAHMFETLHDPKFEIRDWVLSGSVLYVRWDFHFRYRADGNQELIEGMSEIHITADGRVNAHLDHWDSGRQFYENLPVIGWVIRSIRRKIAV